MNSWRCRWCDLNWPRDERYVNCPTCREPTESSGVHPSISDGDAHARASEHEFGWWLWDNDLL